MSGKESQDRQASKAAARRAGGRRSKYRAQEGAVEVTAAVDWGDVDPAALCGAVRAVVRAGDAITFSRTRDGGAFSVTVLSDGLRHFHRKPTAEEIERELREVAEDADAFSRHAG